MSFQTNNKQDVKDIMNLKEAQCAFLVFSESTIFW